MHYPHHSRARILGMSLLVLGGLGSALTFYHPWSSSEKPLSKTSPTTVVARAKPRPKPTAQPVKPLPTVVANQAIDDYLTQQHFSGTALVVRRGRVILRKAYAQRDRSQHLPNETTTPYYIGSAEKAIVATAILQLQDAGKLKISDPIAKYLPDFPNGQQIKLKNLLTHTSGLVGHQETSTAMAPSAIMADIQKNGVRSQPGQWHYLDANYTVLAYLVQKLSGQPLLTYLQQRIFKPAGMDQTGTYETFNAVKNHPFGYQVHHDRFVKTELGSLSQLFGVGNLYMPVTDMYKFDHALMTDRLISKHARKEMLTPGSSSTYGMGFYCNPGSYSNHGIVSGYNVANSFSSSGQTYVVLMANVQNNIHSFGQVTSKIYGFLNQADEAKRPASPTS